LKNDSWFHLNEYIVVVNEGAVVAFVTLLCFDDGGYGIDVFGHQCYIAFLFQLQLSITMAILSKP
jgi:hypothetical protein